MATLQAMQRWANRQAGKIEIDVMPLLRWGARECKTRGRQYAHCHIRNGDSFPRGHICVSRSWASKASIYAWHDTVTHEVVHLRVQDHNSVAFAKWMLKLGYADRREKDRLDYHAYRLAIAGHQHRHEWSELYSTEKASEVRRVCRMCQQEQWGTVTWRRKAQGR